MDISHKMVHRKIMSLVKFLLIVATISKLSKSISFTTVAEPSNYDDNRLEDGNVRVIVPEPFNFANLRRLKTKYELEGFARALNNRYNKLYSSSSFSSLPNNEPGKLSRENEEDDDGFLLDKNGIKFDNNVDNTYSNNNKNNNEEMIFDELVMGDKKDGQDEKIESDLNADLPYGIQNVRRDLSYFTRNSRSKSTGNSQNIVDQETWQTLCPTKRTIIPLETESFEYRPHYYEEVTCFHSHHNSNPLLPTNVNKVCTETGFSCIQLNRTVYLTRRAKDSDCWESETRSVPAGCECMWPKHRNGDIKEFHQRPAPKKDIYKF